MRFLAVRLSGRGADSLGHARLLGSRQEPRPVGTIDARGRAR